MFLSVLLLFMVTGEVVGPRKLYILFVVSRTGSFVSSGVIPMVDYAIQEINNRSSILSNYTISYEEVLDSKCHGRTATNLFMDKFFDNPKLTYIVLVGCGCSVATIPVAQLSHYWNVPHITIASAASILGDKSRFQSLFQILPTIDGIPYTLTVFAKRLGWRQLAVITQQESLFIGMTHKLNLLFQESGLILDDSITIETGKPLPKERLFKWENGSSQRIIVLFTYSAFSYQIMCEAYKRKMFSPKYVWIFYDSPKIDWFDPNITRSCKPPEIDRILNGSLLLLPEAYSPSTNSSYISSSGMSPSRFTKLHRYLLRQPQYQGLPLVGIEGSGYDAIWAMSLGLEEASRRIAVGNDSGCKLLQGELVPLEEFTYDNPKMGCVLQKSIASVKFNGITGPFEFNKNRTRIGNTIIIYQFSVNENGIRTLRKPMVRVVNRDGIRNSILFFIEPLSTLWGKIPYDGYAEKKIREYNSAFVTVFTLLASAGVMFAGVCLAFTIIFRKKKIVKLSSPNLNYLLILGSVILYSHMYLIVYYFTGYDEIAKQSILCNLSVWSLSFGYSLCFSVILAKSGRVYYIFANPSSKKKSIKDWMLFIIVALLTGIDVLLLIIETSTRSTRVKTKIVPDTQQFEVAALVSDKVYFIISIIIH
ncbi:PREDICTED: gamma-aminobutyric acid type B receptor subunit 1-like [Amphimedon queenslandica]|uniref:G-protein coupled receptors family 3 profile domain-containing protein n=1 Tax=Amphimedon queenslandica TaxID=400682 RepID=A0AAN0IV30_AMPQE|nr:PREDICTED: gamma-aminobutyric acid type B receptor subunit 1-like [Amphimedon queenslandica]|eukprot:XP_011409909.1 PREDICTED: gamma-aminobutyric acid type B receptor subunit 1-like [Amphimedon queenslandica]